MYSLFSFLIGAPQGEGGSAPQGAGGIIGSLLPFVAIIGIFYFLIIRPQNKKRKETEKMLSAVKKGDRVTTIGGIHGTVTSARESTVIVKVDDTTKIEFSRSAIASVDSAAQEKEETSDAKE
ncbi:preprotein translocase subunit YajC [Breznakiellaceae bacterium SP9]